VSLKLRISIVFIVFTLLVLALFGGNYYVLEKRTFQKTQEEEQIKTIEKLAQVCRSMHMSSSALIPLNYVQTLKKDPWVIFAACVDSHGRVQVHSDPQWIGKTWDHTEDLSTIQVSGAGRDFHSGQIHLYAPVTFVDTTVGMALIGGDPQVLDRISQTRLLATLSQLKRVGVATFFLAALVGLMLAFSFSRPIGKLVEASRAIGSGRLDFVTPIAQRGDELGVLAREMNQMAKQLKELDETKDELLAQVSHDLRSPMAAIYMYAEHMLTIDKNRDKILPQHQRMLGTIMENAMRLSVFVSNILDSAKMKAGRMEYKVAAVDVGAAISDVAALYAIVAVQRGIKLGVELPSGLWKIQADPDRFVHVLSNLVSNAMKFTDSGGSIAIGARNLESQVEIFVADTGRGIAQKEVSKLFAPFSQTSTVGSGKIVLGTGLGLYLVKKSVEAMGGAVALETAPGKGTRITLKMKGESHAAGD
jgi:signal transduction histidine kinase